MESSAKMFGAFIRTLAFALALFPALAEAQSPIRAFPPGTFQNRAALDAAVAATYQGPANVTNYGSPLAFYSCARAISATFAATLGGVCDVVDTSTGLITCTYHIQANGFTNPSECTGVGASCQTACSITKAYDQSGSGRDMLQATLAQMPHLTFSSTPTGTLPAINCGASGATFLLQATTSGAVSAPVVFSSVSNRNSATTTAGAIIGVSGGVALGYSTSTNTAQVFSSATTLTAAATDSAWHALNALEATSAGLNVDGSDTTGALTSGGVTANNLRLCRGSSQLSGLIAEAGMWSFTSTSTDRSAMSTNQHGTSGYNF